MELDVDKGVELVLLLEDEEVEDLNDTEPEVELLLEDEEVEKSFDRDNLPLDKKELELVETDKLTEEDALARDVELVVLEDDEVELVVPEDDEVEVELLT